MALLCKCDKTNALLIKTKACCFNNGTTVSWLGWCLGNNKVLDLSLKVCVCVQVRDAGSLLSEAKFTLQTVDVDDITVKYNDVEECISHLRVNCSFSCGNACVISKKLLPSLHEVVVAAEASSSGCCNRDCAPTQ
jgi:hypothetical protein